MLEYFEGNETHLPWLALNLRQDDLVELVLATGKQPHEALSRRVLEIPGARVCTIRAPSGNPCAMFGALPNTYEPESGIAWFLATPEIEEHKKELLQTIPPYIDFLSEPYAGGLVAYMWEHNRMHRRWAEAVGFKHCPPGDIILRGNRFLHIHRPR